MSVRKLKRQCQAIPFCPTVKRKRRCGNPGGPSGFCRMHVPKEAPPPAVVGPSDPDFTGPARPGEVELAREVIRKLRDYFQDATTKGRLINALGDYQDLMGDDPMLRAAQNTCRSPPTGKTP